MNNQDHSEACTYSLLILSDCCLIDVFRLLLDDFRRIVTSVKQRYFNANANGTFYRIILELDIFNLHHLAVSSAN